MFEAVREELRPNMQSAAQRCDRRGLAGINQLLAVTLVLAVSTVFAAWLGGYHGGFLTINRLAETWIPDRAWQTITCLGDARVLVLLAVLFARRRPELFWAMIVASVAATLYTRGLKAWVDALRPPGVLPASDFHLIAPALTQHSFPSGHSASIAVFCGVLFIFAERWRTRLAILSIPVLVALSRVAMGVHWPQDVLAGAFGGLMAAALGTWLAHYWRAGLRPAVHLGLVMSLLPMSIVSLCVSDAGNPSVPWLTGSLIGAAVWRYCLDYAPGRCSGVYWRGLMRGSSFAEAGKRYRLLIFMLVLLALQLLFWCVPGIDLRFSRLFFVPGQGFVYASDWLPKLNFWLFQHLPYVMVPGLLGLLFASARRADPAGALFRRKLWFLLLTLALGPGLLVNGVLKMESGRARPYQVEQFGGHERFSAAFERSDQCARNCSFVSGHASMGYFFLALAWVFGRRRWLVYGGMLGLLAGLGRVVQGAHFLSDILFGYPVVLFSAWLSARLSLGSGEIDAPAREA